MEVLSRFRSRHGGRGQGEGEARGIRDERGVAVLRQRAAQGSCFASKAGGDEGEDGGGDSGAVGNVAKGGLSYRSVMCSHQPKQPPEPVL